jgi:hypothetical protein
MEEHTKATEPFYHMFMREARYRGDWLALKQLYNEMAKRGTTAFRHCCAIVCVRVRACDELAIVGLEQGAIALSELLRAALDSGTVFLFFLFVFVCCCGVFVFMT